MPLPRYNKLIMAYREKKVEKLYYSIGEVSSILDEPVSTIRFWENQFAILKPMKNKKGNRLFTATDLKNLSIIHRLIREEGMTIAGVRKKLSGKWEDENNIFEINESLQKIKSLLIELRDNM